MLKNYFEAFAAAGFSAGAFFAAGLAAVFVAGFLAAAAFGAAAFTDAFAAGAAFFLLATGLTPFSFANFARWLKRRAAAALLKTFFLTAVSIAL